MMTTTSALTAPSPVFNRLIAEIRECEENSNYEKMLELLHQLDQIDPGNPDTLSKMGSCQLYLFQLEQAVETFEAVCHLAGDSAEAWNNLGVACFIAGKNAASEEAYLKAVTIDHTDHQTLRNLAQLYLQDLETYSKGLYLLEEVLQRDPEDLDALCMMARCCEETNRAENARILYQRILEKDAEYIPARLAIERLDLLDEPDVI